MHGAKVVRRLFDVADAPIEVVSHEERRELLGQHLLTRNVSTCLVQDLRDDVVMLADFSPLTREALLRQLRNNPKLTRLAPPYRNVGLEDR